MQLMVGIKVKLQITCKLADKNSLVFTMPEASTKDNNKKKTSKYLGLMADSKNLLKKITRGKNLQYKRTFWSFQ